MGLKKKNERVYPDLTQDTSWVLSISLDSGLVVGLVLRWWMTSRLFSCSSLCSDQILLYSSVYVMHNPPPSPPRRKEGIIELTYLPGGLEERDSCMFPFSILWLQFQFVFMLYKFFVERRDKRMTWLDKDDLRLTRYKSSQISNTIVLTIFFKRKALAKLQKCLDNKNLLLHSNFTYYAFYFHSVIK